jgi:Xaa-Pro aminopeptidase
VSVASRTPLGVPAGPITTMTPTIRSGRSCFDRRRLPRDEYARRVRDVEALARAAHLDAVVVLAGPASPGPVVHLANLAPTAGVAAVVVVPGSGAVLLAGRGGEREEPYQRDVTWIASLVQSPFGADSVRRVLAERGVVSGRLGIAGLDDQVPVRARDRFVAGIPEFEMVPVDRELAELRRRLSVRELAVLGEVDGLVGSALELASREFRKCGMPARAALVAEEELYASGCRDVRILLGWPDGSLRPLEALDGHRAPLFTCYVAAELLGYWIERAVTVGQPETSGRDGGGPLARAVARAVAVAVALLRPGADPAAVSAAAGARGVDVRLRGLGTELADLPDAGTGWTQLDTGDAVSVLAVGCERGALVLESRTAAVGVEGPGSLADLMIPGLR